MSTVGTEERACSLGLASIDVQQLGHLALTNLAFLIIGWKACSNFQTTTAQEIGFPSGWRTHRWRPMLRRLSSAAKELEGDAPRTNRKISFNPRSAIKGSRAASGPSASRKASVRPQRPSIIMRAAAAKPGVPWCRYPKRCSNQMYHSENTCARDRETQRP